MRYKKQDTDLYDVLINSRKNDVKRKGRRMGNYLYRIKPK